MEWGEEGFVRKADGTAWVFKALGTCGTCLWLMSVPQNSPGLQGTCFHSCSPVWFVSLPWRGVFFGFDQQHVAAVMLCWFLGVGLEQPAAPPSSLWGRPVIHVTVWPGGSQEATGREMLADPSCDSQASPGSRHVKDITAPAGMMGEGPRSQPTTRQMAPSCHHGDRQSCGSPC